MAMTEADERKADDLVKRLQDDEIQRKLKQGFETDFANSVIDQWGRLRHLSARQLEVLEDLVQRHDDPYQPPRRRYEGHHR